MIQRIPVPGTEREQWVETSDLKCMECDQPLERVTREGATRPLLGCPTCLAKHTPALPQPAPVHQPMLPFD